MIKRFAKLVLVGCLAATGALAGTIALTPSGIVDSTSSYLDTTGWSFIVTQSLQVVALDYYDAGGDGLLASHDVGIWTSGGTLLASVTIPSGTGATLNGLYRSVSITPITLTPGSYEIGGLDTARNDPYILTATGESTVAGVTFDNGGFVSYANVLTFPGPIGNNARPNFLSANFEVGAITPSAVPEPATWGLLGVGIAGLAAVRRKLR